MTMYSKAPGPNGAWHIVKSRAKRSDPNSDLMTANCEKLFPESQTMEGRTPNPDELRCPICFPGLAAR